MWFWWFMFVCNLLIPVLLIVVGYGMWKHCPGKINTVGTVGGILCMVQTVVLVISILPTEKALKRTFTEDGERR